METAAGEEECGDWGGPRDASGTGYGSGKPEDWGIVEGPGDGDEICVGAWPEDVTRWGAVPGLVIVRATRNRYMRCLDGFWIGQTEVTQGQWQRVMGEQSVLF